jgi:hypothetical protein
MKMRVLGLTAAFSLSGTAIFAATVAKPGVAPVEAELMTSVYAHKMQVGQIIFARVLTDWRNSDCILDSGAILEAHVIAVVPHTKTVKGSEVDLAFTRAQCGTRKLKDFQLLLAAMAGPAEQQDLGIFSDPLPFSPQGGATESYSNSFVNAQSAASVSVEMASTIGQAPVMPSMKMGDVSNIKGLKLSVGTGPDNSSVLSSKDHDVAVEMHTVLLLIPAQGAIPRMAATPGAAAPASVAASAASAASASDAIPAAPAEPPIEDIDLCLPPQCNVALPSGTASDMGNAAVSISISQLGYVPRPQRPVAKFDFDEALAYLGSRELLVAFDPHILVPRHSLGRSGSTTRVIRAAVLDTETRRVTHTVDWEMPDNRQFLWPLGQGRVLVHVGSELRAYGAGLKIQNRIPLDGPLAFVRVTPDGSFLAVGEIRERHSPELHSQLKESLNGAEPEEDVDIRVLNRNFEIISKSTSRSDLIAPTLLNGGQAQLLAQPNMRYRISVTPWSNQPSTLVRFFSSCTPEISGIASDLIFLVSCDKQNDEFEYRVLRPNGKVALRGISSINEFGYAAEGSNNQEVFVVKAVQTTRPVTSGDTFRAADFSSEELRVYRAVDGKRLLGVRVGSPPSSRDGYALASDGSQLAVLTGDDVAVYSVPEK